MARPGEPALPAAGRNEDIQKHIYRLLHILIHVTLARFASFILFVGGMQRAIEGVHEDTGRKVCINFDLPANAPIQLPDHLIAALDWVLKFPGSDSLRSLAEYFDREDSMGLGTTQGKNGNLGFFNAISKFMGNPMFCERLSISQKDVLRLDHLVEQYEDGQAITFQLMHRSQLDPKICPHDRVHFEKIHGQPYFIGDFNKAKPPEKWTLQRQL